MKTELISLHSPVLCPHKTTEFLSERQNIKLKVSVSEDTDQGKEKTLPAPFYSLKGTYPIGQVRVDSPLGDRGERWNIISTYLHN